MHFAEVPLIAENAKRGLKVLRRIEPGAMASHGESERALPTEGACAESRIQHDDDFRIRLEFFDDGLVVLIVLVGRKAGDVRQGFGILADSVPVIVIALNVVSYFISIGEINCLKEWIFC